MNDDLPLQTDLQDEKYKKSIQNRRNSLELEINNLEKTIKRFSEVKKNREEKLRKFIHRT